jgi:monofunctional biosynthetic peptidoglycan transglycosylase
MVYNWNEGRIVLGASTISQQTVKNLFLSPDRSLIRKWHELLLTLLMEQMVDKKDILATYLNIVEFGKGIYGIHAAASHYYGLAPAQLSREQMIALAASLPSPKKSNPTTRSRFHTNRINKIRQTIARYYEKPKPSTSIAESTPEVIDEESESLETDTEEFDEAETFAPEEVQSILPESPEAEADIEINLPPPLEDMSDQEELDSFEEQEETTPDPE